MTQLTDQVREAILGNVGTIIGGRVGITDAELLEKKFSPTYDAEDLTKIPNYQSVTSVLINGVPSSAFSMSLLPPMGKSNDQLRDAVKKLSAVKYGKPRSQVDKEIFSRLGAGDEAKKAKLEAMRHAQQSRFGNSSNTAPAGPTAAQKPATGASFLDDWLTKRQQIKSSQTGLKTQGTAVGVNSAPLDGHAPVQKTAVTNVGPRVESPVPDIRANDTVQDKETVKPDSTGDKLHIRNTPDNGSAPSEVSVKLR